MDLTNVLINWKQLRREPFKTDQGDGRLKASVVQMPILRVKVDGDEVRVGLTETSSWLRVNPIA